MFWTRIPDLRDFTSFSGLPFELQLAIWEFALPRRTIYLAAHEVRCGVRLPRPLHGTPAIAQVCRAARKVAHRSGGYLYFEGSVPRGRPRAAAVEDGRTCDNVTWFDRACDTLFLADLLLWPQDTEANPVALSFPVGYDDDQEVALDLWLDVNSQLMAAGVRPDPLHSQGLRLQLLPPTAPFRTARTGASEEGEVRGPRENSRRSSASSPVSNQGVELPRQPEVHQPTAKLVDLRLWPRTEAAYTDRDLAICMERPLPALIRAEFFPEGSTVTHIDLSSLSPYTSSTSFSASTRNLTVERLSRLMCIYSETQDRCSSPRWSHDMRLLNHLIGPTAGEEGEDAATGRTPLLASKRKDLEFKWLRNSWIQLSRAERENPVVRGAPCDVAMPTRFYRMPRPYAAAFAEPRGFDMDHPWVQARATDMPRLRLSLLIRLEGEAVTGT
ncbi:hypothetical protein DL762_006087 [Monosporascus cannonballus]|uniref:2EXR domain-containing protein n=1 Tax=Monosporascus cannonballus TaxID=155416 RepID=A0ABY0H311_9PEZI|nr:hypothetical protein DL762_006087 [Monosporascus cannonballus]